MPGILFPVDCEQVHSSLPFALVERSLPLAAQFVYAFEAAWYLTELHIHGQAMWIF